MAKDPAFLFYPNDYIGGTMGMTFEEKGAYMELLMMQFNRGHMTSHMIGQTVGQLWVKIEDKFSQDSKGLWYNIRLEEEQLKRKSYTDSRKNNIKGENQYSSKIKKVGHMTSHMEDVNEDVNESKVKNVILPFDSAKFLDFWNTWKEYKIDQFKFKYASTTSEQITLKKLCTLSNGDESTACEIIEQSIANGWKGFFEIKDNGKQISQGRLEERAREVLSKYN